MPGPYATSEGTGDETIVAAPLVSIAVAPATATLKVGQWHQFTATGTYADSDTAKGAGSAHVIATQGAAGAPVLTGAQPELTPANRPVGAASQPGGGPSPPSPQPAPAPTGR